MTLIKTLDPNDNLVAVNDNPWSSTQATEDLVDEIGGLIKTLTPSGILVAINGHMIWTPAAVDVILAEIDDDTLVVTRDAHGTLVAVNGYPYRTAAVFNLLVDAGAQFSVTDRGISIITSRQWSTALAPVEDAPGEFNFITQAYNYPTDEETEWVVMRLSPEGTYSIYPQTASMYSNTNYQVASANSAITSTNQLRDPAGCIWFLERCYNGQAFVAYYDPTDEAVHQCTPASVGTGQTYLYVGGFNQDGSKLYVGTQAAGAARAGVLEIDTATKVATWLGYAGTSTPDFPRYAYQVAKDGGNDFLYVTVGQSFWELVAFDVTTGESEVLITTGGPGTQRIQLQYRENGIEATVLENGVSTNYWVADGALSAYPGSGSPTGGDRVVDPFNGALDSSAPTVDWTTGIGLVRYQKPAYYPILTPTSGQWASVFTAAGVSWSAPSSIHQMQEATGSFADTGGAGRALTVVGTGMTRGHELVNIPGRKFIRLTEAFSNRLDLTIPNANTNSALIYVQVAAYANASALRKVIEHPGIYCEMTSVPRYRADAAAVVDGTMAPAMTVHDVWLKYRLSSECTVLAMGEVIAGGFFSASGTTASLGSSAGTDSPPLYIGYAAWWFGAAAERSNAEILAVRTALGHASALIIPPWVSLPYEVSNTAPIPIESLHLLSDGCLGSGSQYNGFFRYNRDSEQTTWFGAWPGGVSQPRYAEANGLIYFAGYPDGVLYAYDPDRPWAPDGTVVGNPSLVGYFNETSDTKYAGKLVYSADGNLYLAGRKERSGDGSVIAKYNIENDAFGEFTAQEIDKYNPRGMVVLDSVDRVVFSGSIKVGADLSVAKLIVFSRDLGYVGQYQVAPGLNETGELFATTDNDCVIGFAGALLYRFNAMTGLVTATSTLSDAPSAFCQVSAASVWVAIGTDLFQINTTTLEAKNIGDVSDVDGGVVWLATDGSRAYLAGSYNLYTGK